MSIRLARGGTVAVTEWNRDAQAHETKFILPATSAEMFGLWYRPLEGVEFGYRLRDLFDMLGRLDEEAVRVVGVLSDMNLALWLKEAALPPDPREPGVDYLRVYWTANLETYVEDPERPDIPPNLTSDGSVSTGAMYGKWTPPYTISTGFDGWGDWHDYGDGPTKGGISFAGTPLRNYLDYELRYEPTLTFFDDYAGGKPIFETTVGITVGDFIQAVLWEIGWHGDPETNAAILPSPERDASDA